MIPLWAIEFFAKYGRKLLLGLALVVSYALPIVFAYHSGKQKCELQHAAEVAALEKKHAEEIAAEAQERIRIAEQAQERIDRIQRNNAEGLKRLGEVVREAGPECDLTDEEVQALEHIGTSE
jgi:uncharacterized protein HemX